MSAANPASDENAGSGTTWFKIYEDAPVYTGGQLVFPSQSMQSFTFTIPASVPSGMHLFIASLVTMTLSEPNQANTYYA